MVQITSYFYDDIYCQHTLYSYSLRYSIRILTRYNGEIVPETIRIETSGYLWELDNWLFSVDVTSILVCQIT